MASYQNVLIAVDIDATNKKVVEKALSVAASAARLSLIHVIELIQIQGPIAAIDYSHIHKHTEEYALDTLAQLGDTFGIEKVDQYVLEGSAKNKIHEFAEQNNIDLIIIGSHGRNGISLLLGSTANAVLHGAKCDVLAVRV